RGLCGIVAGNLSGHFVLERIQLVERWNEVATVERRTRRFERGDERSQILPCNVRSIHESNALINSSRSTNYTDVGVHCHRYMAVADGQGDRMAPYVQAISDYRAARGVSGSAINNPVESQRVMIDVH